MAGVAGPGVMLSLICGRTVGFRIFTLPTLPIGMAFAPLRFLMSAIPSRVDAQLPIGNDNHDIASRERIIITPGLRYRNYQSPVTHSYQLAFCQCWHILCLFL